MPWTHCENAALADTADCPTCGQTKAAWTVSVDATRTLVVGRKARPKRAKDAWLEVELRGAAGAACAVELADGQVVEAALDAAGKLRLDGLYPGECRVRFPGRAARAAGVGAPPADEQGWVACATGATHPFELLASGGGLRIVWPETAEHVQWVNLRPDPADRSRGNRLALRVAAPPGTTVHAALRPRAGNSARNVPLPGLVGPTSQVAPAAGEVTFDVELGCAGKDRFELAVGDTPACDGPMVLVETRRKIFIQFARTPDQALSDLAAARAAYEEVGIELERLEDVLVAPPAAPPGEGQPVDWLPSSELPSDGRPAGPRLVGGNHNWGRLRGVFPPGPSPRLRVLVVDELYDAGRTPAGGAETLEFELPFRRPCEHDETSEDEDIRRGYMIETRYSLAGNRRILQRSLHDGTPSVRGGTWTSASHGAGAIAADDVRIRFSVGLAVTLRRADGSVYEPTLDDPARVRLEVAMTLGEKQGRSERGDVLVVHRRDAWFDAVVVHELGHSLGQAGGYGGVAPGLSKETHGRLYANDFNHSGPHCAHGLSDEEYARRRHAGGAPACVMWGAAPAAAGTSPPNGGGFCARCAPYVRAHHCRQLESGPDDPPAW